MHVPKNAPHNGCVVGGAINSSETCGLWKEIADLE
jgi:hypothetical protein